MKVLFDHQAFSIQDVGGVSRYFYELIKHLACDPEIEVELSLWFSKNRHLTGGNSVGFSSKSRSNLRFPFQLALNQLISRRRLIRGGFDIFHPTYYRPYFLGGTANKPFVLTIFDMIHELFLKKSAVDVKVVERKRLLASQATRIIAISQATKEDIIRILKVPESKIDVVYLANSLRPFRKKEDSAQSNSHEQRYLLFVGLRNLAYKNFRGLVEALTPLLRADPELKLVCAGGGEFSREERAFFRLRGLDRQLAQANVNDTALAELYGKAKALVLPSFYEGFGLPVVEAWGCGCPVITSRAGSLEEIAGNAAEYIEPEDPDSMLSAVKKVAYDEDFRTSLVERGRKRVRSFSWEKTASQTKDAYTKALP